MKLFSIKILSTVTLLSTTMLLSACGGNSDSSGGKYEFKDKKDNENNNILDVFNGSWKSNCQQTKHGSAILYFSFNKIDNDNLLMNGKVQEFMNKNCVGSQFTVETAKQPKKVKKSELLTDKSIKIIDNNHWIRTDNKERFTRISTNEYNRVK